MKLDLNILILLTLFCSTTRGDLIEVFNVLSKCAKRYFFTLQQDSVTMQGSPLNQELTDSETLVNTFQLWNDQQWNDLPDLAKSQKLLLN